MLNDSARIELYDLVILRLDNMPAIVINHFVNDEYVLYFDELSTGTFTRKWLVRELKSIIKFGDL